MRPMAILAGVAIAAGLAGCGSGGQPTAPDSLPSSACSGVKSGGAAPDVLIASDLPSRGPAAAASSQMRSAIALELERAGYRAGRFRVGLQACDDSAPGRQGWSSATCRRNADAYADADVERLVGVIGPYDSGCAVVEIPVLNQAETGALPLLSPVNTYPCLTQGGAGCDLSEPGTYYPSLRRNYFRVAAGDVVQAAAAAQFARSRGSKRIFILHDGEAYGVGLATGFRQAARAVGLSVVGFAGWDPGADGYRRLFEAVRRSGADTIYVAGVPERDGARLLADKVRVLGPNDGAVRVIASDAFASLAAAGGPARDLVVGVAGQPLERFDLEARRIAQSAAHASGATEPDPLAIYAAATTRILLHAIAGSNGDRDSVRRQLFRRRVRDGLVGSFSFASTGEPRDATGAVTAVTFWRATNPLVPVATISPRQATIDAAATGG